MQKRDIQDLPLKSASSSPATRRTSWIAGHRRRPEATVRIFCLPYAGGGASVYRTWVNEVPSYIEAVPVQPPGREDRYAEEPLRRMEDMVSGLIDSLQPLMVEMPFAFFGHSLGGVVALEAARALDRGKAPAPCHVFISGRPAPHLPLRRTPVFNQSLEELKAWLRSVQGTSDAVLECEEMMDLIVPLIRADLQINDTYRSTAEPPLACPLTILGGLRDDEATADELEQWAPYTSQSFNLRMLNGDHFFPFNEARPSALATVVEALPPSRFAPRAQF
jgi:medium-chain acyl-[acyl-carrier-protein] hydrolase